jgi:hypothetical protein
LDLDGSLIVASKAITIHGSKLSQTISLGSTAKDMHIADEEPGRMSTVAGLTVGSSHSGDLFVSNVSDANSDSVGTITLVATQLAKKVIFHTQASSFNRGIVVQAKGGVILSQSVTTKQDDVVVRGGTGSLKIMDRMTLSTTNKLLTITADDVDIRGTAKMSTGTASLTIATETPVTIGVGTATEQMDISANELSRVTTT